jgi:hypothetical protein
VIVFNQKVREARRAKGKLGAILKSSALIEVEGNSCCLEQAAPGISVCQPRDLFVHEAIGCTSKQVANSLLATEPRMANSSL